MNIAKLFTRSMINDLGIWIVKLFHRVGILCFAILSILKFIFYDITIVLNKLPFGNWLSIIYFITAITFTKNVFESNEFNRLIYRVIDLWFIQREPLFHCIYRFHNYLLRIIAGELYYLQLLVYDCALFVWDHTGGSIKKEVTRFAKEIILENSEEINRAVKDMTKTVAISAMVNAVSQKLLTDLSQVAISEFSKSNIAKLITDIQYSALENTDKLRICSSQMEYALGQMAMTNENINALSLNLAESFAMIKDATLKGELHLLENNMILNQKMADISLQIEYLRATQPTKLQEILNSLSLSTLAINNAGLPSTLANTLAKITGTFGSFASQQGRERIENI